MEWREDDYSFGYGFLYVFLYLIEKTKYPHWRQFNASYLYLCYFIECILGLSVLPLTSWKSFLIILRASHVFITKVTRTASVNWTSGKLSDCRSMSILHTFFSNRQFVFLFSRQTWLFLWMKFAGVHFSCHKIFTSRQFPEIPFKRMSLTTNNEFNSQSCISIPLTCSKFEMNLNSKEWKIRSKLQWPRCFLCVPMVAYFAIEYRVF